MINLFQNYISNLNELQGINSVLSIIEALIQSLSINQQNYALTFPILFNIKESILSKIFEHLKNIDMNNDIKNFLEK